MSREELIELQDSACSPSARFAQDSGGGHGWLREQSSLYPTLSLREEHNTTVYLDTGTYRAL